MNRKYKGEVPPNIRMVHSKNNHLFVDGEEVVGRPRGFGHADFLYYVDDHTADVLSCRMSYEDTAMSRAGIVDRRFIFNHGKAFPVEVAPVSSWGVDAETVEEARAELLEKVECAQRSGIVWSMSAASTIMKLAKGKFGIAFSNLKVGVRELALACVHQGPADCLMGGADDAQYWDRKQAFLSGMKAQMPFYFSRIYSREDIEVDTGEEKWWSERNSSRSPSERIQTRNSQNIFGRDSILEFEGLCCATVFVPPELYAGRIPPLPMKIWASCVEHSRIVYPVGFVKGCWTLGLLRDAVRNGGVRVLCFHEVYKADKMEACYEPLATYLESLSDDNKALTKPLYTRFWGVLCSLGSYIGRKAVNRGRQDEEDYVYNEADELYWHRKDFGGILNRGLTFHPEHAAFITANNHIAMNVALRKFGADEVIGCHLDGISCKRRSTSPGVGFVEKDELHGACRMWSTNWYQIGDSEPVAMGMPGEVTRERIQEVVERKLEEQKDIEKDFPSTSRSWRNFPPQVGVEAVSDPIEYTMKDMEVNYFSYTQRSVPLDQADRWLNSAAYVWNTFAWHDIIHHTAIGPLDYVEYCESLRAQQMLDPKNIDIHGKLKRIVPPTMSRSENDFYIGLIVKRTGFSPLLILRLYSFFVKSTIHWLSTEKIASQVGYAKKSLEYPLALMFKNEIIEQRKLNDNTFEWKFHTISTSRIMNLCDELDKLLFLCDEHLRMYIGWKSNPTLEDI